MTSLVGGLAQVGLEPVFSEFRASLTQRRTLAARRELAVGRSEDTVTTGVWGVPCAMGKSVAHTKKLEDLVPQTLWHVERSQNMQKELCEVLSTQAHSPRVSL